MRFNQLAMKKLFIIIFLLSSLSACQQDTASLADEANALCAIYAPESLQATEGMDLLTTFDYVNTKIRNTIKSKEFNHLFEELANEGNADFYAALEKKVSALLGKEWVCENAKAFYSITWQRAESSQDVKIIPVNIVDNEFYEINGAQYAFSDVDKIKNALDELSNGAEFKLQLSIPASTGEEALNNYLNPLREIGIKHLTLVEQTEQ